MYNVDKLHRQQGEGTRTAKTTSDLYTLYTSCVGFWPNPGWIKAKVRTEHVLGPGLNNTQLTLLPKIQFKLVRLPTEGEKTMTESCHINMFGGLYTQSESPR